VAHSLVECVMLATFRSAIRLWVLDGIQPVGHLREHYPTNCFPRTLASRWHPFSTFTLTSIRDDHLHATFPAFSMKGDGIPASQNTFPSNA
jgi:hypothetical protein